MKRGGLATPATSQQLHCPLLFIQSQLWRLTYGDSPSSKEGLLPLTQLPCANHFSLPNPLATFATLSLLISYPTLTQSFVCHFVRWLFSIDTSAAIIGSGLGSQGRHKVIMLGLGSNLGASISKNFFFSVCLMVLKKFSLPYFLCIRKLFCKTHIDANVPINDFK